jgi:rubrerythrin
MANQLTVQAILEKAIEKEIESQQLYRSLSQQMTNEVAKDAFVQLSWEEQGHENLLRKYLGGELGEGDLRKEQVLDYKIAESFWWRLTGRRRPTPFTSAWPGRIHRGG